MAAATASRVALVTGSTTGLGYGIARALASKGHSIILSGFGDDKEIKSCVDLIKRYETQCLKCRTLIRVQRSHRSDVTKI